MIEGEQFCEKFEIQSNHQKVVQSNKVKRSMIEKTLCKPPKIYAIKYLPFCKIHLTDFFVYWANSMLN